MAWPILLTAIFWVTCGAWAKVEFPAWLAAMVQVPGATAVTVLPLTVQMPGVVLLNVTARPELALAETAAVPGKLNAGAAPKLMVCDRASMAGPLPTPPPQAASSNVVSAAVRFPDFILMQ
jgi:hypothetical protein